MPATTPATDVTDYVDTLDEPRKSAIAAIYAKARDLAPDAVEGRKYAMPALVVAGKGLISVMSTKKHIGIYPYSGTIVNSFADQLSILGIPTTKGAIQLPDGVELPDDLLNAIIHARLTELAT